MSTRLVDCARTRYGVRYDVEVDGRRFRVSRDREGHVFVVDLGAKAGRFFRSWAAAVESAASEEAKAAVLYAFHLHWPRVMRQSQ